jgi:hypothetical protein
MIKNKLVFIYFLFIVIYFNTFHLFRIVLLLLPPLRDVVLRGGVVGRFLSE